MPKRDQAYMDEQRTAIARAALKVLLEKGVYATSLRDICRAAGVSIGALYTHFATKEEAIVAACSLDREEHEDVPPVPDWDSYVAAAIENLPGRGRGRADRRIRLSLQFVAELIMMETSPAGLAGIYLHYRETFSRNLAYLHERAEISLPLGLATTTEIHMQLTSGVHYQIASYPELDIEFAKNAFIDGLALTAGRKR